MKMNCFFRRRHRRRQLLSSLLMWNIIVAFLHTPLTVWTWTTPPTKTAVSSSISASPSRFTLQQQFQQHWSQKVSLQSSQQLPSIPRKQQGRLLTLLHESNYNLNIYNSDKNHHGEQQQQQRRYRTNRPRLFRARRRVSRDDATLLFLVSDKNDEIDSEDGNAGSVSNNEEDFGSEGIVIVDDNGVEEEDEETMITQIADALTSTTATASTMSLPPGKEGSIDNDSIQGNNNNKEEEEKYLTLAKEAWTKFFSDQISQEEYVNMALDAWDNASSSSSLLVEKAQQQQQQQQPFVDEESQQQQQKQKLQQQQQQLVSDDDELEESIGGSGDASRLKAEEKEEENSKPSGSVPPPPSSSVDATVVSSPAIEITGGNNSNDALKNYINSIRKAKLLGEWVSPQPSSINKSFTSPPPSPSLKRKMKPAVVASSAIKKAAGNNNRDALKNYINSIRKAKSLEEKQNTMSPQPMSIDDVLTSPVLKGKETSLLGDNVSNLSSSSSTPSTPSLKGKWGPPSSLKGKWGKFSPKKMNDTVSAAKTTNWRLSGPSFFTSDKLSNEGTAEKNDNPVNKGVTKDNLKLNGLDIGDQEVINGEAKVDDSDGKSSSKVDENQEPGDEILGSITEPSAAPPPTLTTETSSESKSFTSPQPLPIVNKVILTPMKGAEKLSSPPPPTPPLPSAKGGVKLGIQGKFASKKIDITATNKSRQGNRGGLSFLKSDKLSKEYKAEKNYNPMNKGITVNTLKLKDLKKLSVKTKSDNDELEESSSEDEDQLLGGATLKTTPKSSTASPSTMEKSPAIRSIIERWSKELFEPILKGSESNSATDDLEVLEGKTATISITDEGGTDVVNPGRAFIPPPRASVEKKGSISSGVKFATTKLGSVKKFSSPLGGSGQLKGSAKILASKSGLLKGGATKLGSLSGGGFLNNPGSANKLDFPLLKKGGGLPFQKSGGITGVKNAPGMMGLKVKGSPLLPINVNGSGANDSSKSTFAGGTSKTNPPLPFKTVSTSKFSPPMESPKTISPPVSAQINIADAKKPNVIAADGDGAAGITVEEAAEARVEGASEPIVMPVIKEGMTAEEAQAVRKRRLENAEIDFKVTTTANETDDAVVKSTGDLFPVTVLISEGMTAEEAEIMRMRRLRPDEKNSSNIVYEKSQPMIITEGISREEEDRARMASLQTSDTANETIPIASFDSPSKTSSPLTQKGFGDGSLVKKGLDLPFFTQKGFGDSAVAKTGFPPPPMPLKGAPSFTINRPINQKAAEFNNDGFKKGLSLKGGDIKIEKKIEITDEKNSFIKKAPSFSMSMEKKTLPPLSMKGPWDGATKGLALPPLVKKGFGDGAVGKTGFPSPPMPLKGAVGPISEVSDGGESEADDDNDSRAPGPGLPLKGGISTGVKQPEQAIKNMPFMKKAPSFSMSMEKKSMPPLSMKGPWDGATKGLGLPPLAKKGFGDGAVGKTGFPSPPMPLKGAVGPISEVSDGGESVADDDNDSRAPGPGLPLKGGISTGVKQPEQAIKSMPFMKKAPSFSMSMEKKSMPPLSMKGPGDGGTKGLGLPPLAKKGFGDGAVGKTGFPSPPMPLKGAVGPISEVSDGGESVADDDNDSRAPGPGLPLKGGISTGVKQPEQAIKSMPFMKKAPSFSMSMEKKPMPPLSMKGPWDGATKGLGLPPLATKGFGDGAVGKTGFPSPPMPLKGAVGPISEVSDGGESVADDDNDSRAPGPGLPLKGGISTGVKQPEQAIKSMPFMKKAPSFSMSMEKKPLPPLSMKGPWDGATKGLGLPLLAKKGFGDGAVGKTGFPSPPMPLKGAVGPISEVSDGGESVADDDNDSRAPGPGLPLKGGISTGVKQPEQAIKSMPFMKKAPSFSMSMEKKSMPPLSMKGPWDGGTKGLGLPPLAKKGFGDGAVGKTGFPSPPMPLKGAVGPISEVSDGGESVADDDNDSRAPGPGLPLKGGISTGVKQPEQAIKSMPFMKKAPSFSMSMEKKSMPPLSMKGPGDGATKGLGLPPLATKRFGDGAVGKTGFPSPPMPLKGLVGPISEVSDGGESVADDDNDSRAPGPGLDFTDDFSDSKGSVSSWSSTPDKELGTGAPFLPQFAPPPLRGEAREPNDFSWLESAEAVELDKLAALEDASSIEDDARMKESRKPAQSKEATKLWSGESFLGKSSSRVYGLGSVRPSGFSGEKGNEVSRPKSSGAPSTARNDITDTWASEDTANSARLFEMNDAMIAAEKRLIDQKKESMITEEKRLIDEKAKIASLLSATEKRLSIQLEKFEKERQILRDDRAKFDAERSEAENRIREIESGRVRAEKEAELRFVEKNSALAAQLSDAERARTEDGKRLVEEKAKVAALISEAEKKVAIQLEKFKEERLKMNKEKEMASVEKLKAQKEVEEADLARKKAEEDARMLETLLSEQKMKQEKWMEEQKLRMEQTLEKRIAEEKSKMADEKAKEESKLAEEQKRLVEEQLEQRSSEEKSKLDAEIVAAEEKIRRELEILESERSAQVVVKDDEEVLDIPRPDDAELKVPNDVLESMKGLPTLASTQSDTLATDVEALELISMCEPDYNSKSPSCILPSDYPFVSLLRDSSPYIVNHRHSTIVYHVPGDLISDVEKFNSVMDDIALTWLFGMKIVVCVGCRTQVSKRLDMLQGGRSKHTSGIRITTSEALRVLEEEAGFCRFEVERQLNRCLRNKGADCNVVSGCFITAKKFGEVDGVNYQLTGYPTTLQTHRINHFLSRSDVVLLTPLGFTENGEALNIKSEQLAGFTAGALKASKVVYFSTMPLVMRGSNDSGEANVNQRIQMIQRSSALQILSHHGLRVNSKTGFPHWKSKSTAAALNSDIQAMLLKMGWATDAIDKGVERAHIIPSEDGALLEELFTARRGYGTCISQDDYEAPHPEDQNDDLFAIDEVGAGMVEW